MAHDVGPAASPVGYTARGEPTLFAPPLAPADVCAPGGAWSVLRPPNEDHPQVAGNFESVVFPTPDIRYVRATDGLLLKTVDGDTKRAASGQVVDRREQLRQICNPLDMADVPSLA